MDWDAFTESDWDAFAEDSGGGGQDPGFLHFYYG